MKLQNTFNTYQALFEGGNGNDQLLKESAAHFFRDLSDWLVQLIYLQMGRLTDPARSLKKQNLTVEHIVASLEELELLNEEIVSISKSIDIFRKKIIPARNKAIAHLDLKAFRDVITHGEHEKSDAYMFHADLNKFTDEVGRVIGVGPLDYSVQSGGGDVFDLLRLLKTHHKIRRLFC